jgi:hypothetical protein
MTVRTTTVGTDTFTMLFGILNDETVLVNGDVVSKIRTFRPVSVHTFMRDEHGASVPYSVTLAGPFGYVIRRNGDIVAEDVRVTPRVIFGFLLAFALSFVVKLAALGVGRMAPDLAGAAESVSDASALLALALTPVFAIWLGRRLRRPPPAPAAPPV